MRRTSGRKLSSWSSASLAEETELNYQEACDLLQDKDNAIRALSSELAATAQAATAKSKSDYDRGYEQAVADLKAEAVDA